MPFLGALRIRCLRNIGLAELSFQAPVCVIEGENGSGKTSLLDAVHILGTGRTFSGGVASDFITRGSEATVVSGDVDDGGRKVLVGVEKSKLTTVCKADGNVVRSASVLMGFLPVLSLDSQLYQLVSNSPSYRRSMLDRTLFHVEPGYLELFKKFHRSMQHRNELLRTASNRQAMEFWDEEFASLGTAMDQRRQDCVDRLNARLSDVEPWADAGRGALKLEYRSGWRSGIGLRDALVESRTRELDWKTTMVGPQRAELRVSVAGSAVRLRISRGQAKRIACHLVAAQLEMLEQEANVRPVLLVDDLAAELDATAQRTVLEILLSGKRQALVTTIDYRQLPKGTCLDHAQRFHVERGHFSPG